MSWLTDWLFARRRCSEARASLYADWEVKP